MVWGVWDCIGLLFAGSGLLLVVGPAILKLLYAKAVDAVSLEDNRFDQAVGNIWLEWWGITIAYYAALILGVVLVLWLRRDKTVIYNVDPDKFELVLSQTLTRLGLSAARSGRYIRIGRARPASDVDLPADSFRAVELGIAALESRPERPAPLSLAQEPDFVAG